MQGGDERSGSLFSYVDLEARVGKDHPLRTIRVVVNEALTPLRASSRRFTRELVALRSHPRIFFARCCCRRSNRSGQNGS